MFIYKNRSHKIIIEKKKNDKIISIHTRIIWLKWIKLKRKRDKLNEERKTIFNGILKEF